MGFLKKIASLFLKASPSGERTAGTPPSFSVHELTTAEKEYCAAAQLSEAYGLLLKSLTNSPVEKLEFEAFEEDEIEKPSGIYSQASEEIARQIIARHQERILNEGHFLFLSDLSLKGYNVALVANITDPYELMKLAGTNGANYDIETDDIIAKYKKWDQEFGIRPIGIGFDFCECEILNKDIDYAKLAAEVYEFCPDVVEQGTDTVEALEEDMSDTGIIYLWWD